MWPLLLYVASLLFAFFASGVFLYGVYQFVREASLVERVHDLFKTLGLKREEINPILEARPQSWEQGGVMNPAAVKVGDTTHLFYRAVGNDGVSRIGYAASKDGVRIDERSPFPVFALLADAGGPAAFKGNESLSASGGSHAFAGVEDPRAVVLDDKLHLSFNAFSDWGSLRTAVTTLSLSDLLARRWKWTPPVYLSPKGQVHKNWLLFPERINGRYNILHSLHSGSRERVMVEQLPALVNDPGIESPYYSVEDETVWDSKLRGAGPPPIKTKKGWLVLYHANDKKEPHRYKIGAMLLDLLDPSKVLARSPVPVLTPDAWYENNGKPGVVYATGATVEGDTLRVYYGGGDQVICTAATSLSKLLEKLVPPSQVGAYSLA